MLSKKSVESKVSVQEEMSFVFSSATEERGLLGALKVIFMSIFLNVFEKIYKGQSMLQLYKWRHLRIFVAANANSPL